MGILDIYSKRQKRERGEVPDVYQYKDIPRKLRAQIVHIWHSAIGDPGSTGAARMFAEIRDVLCREYGVFELTRRTKSDYEEIEQFMLESTNTEEVLDVIELSFQGIDLIVRDSSYEFKRTQHADAAIEELNARFRENGVGFQYASGKMVRVDSQTIHSEVVKPALQLLSGKDYKGANQEFLSAHEHYRHARFKECLNDCLKAFESTMKSICVKRGWQHDANDTAKPLLDVMFQRGLIPAFMQSHFSGLRSTLEAGVPTVRNKLGGHGQGASQIEVPEYLAAYALHLTATNILMLAEAEKALK